MINGKTTKNIADKCQSAKKIGNNIDVDPKCPERSLRNSTKTYEMSPLQST